MALAAIDIGTNTVLLLVLPEDRSAAALTDDAVITRLGENLQGTGLLAEAAMERTFGAVERYLGVARRHGADRLVCIGTAALREAKNGPLFVERVRSQLAVEVRVLTEEEEAFFTYLSVRGDKAFPKAPLTIIDIGGGSTEIIRGDEDRFEGFLSVPIGSVKLTEMFIGHDPPLGREVAALEDFLRERVRPEGEAGPRALVGTAGTVTNLAAIALGLEAWDGNRVHGLRVTKEEIDGMIGRLLPLTLRERQAVRGMEAGRADVFPQGLMLLSHIMGQLDAREILVSVKGVRYGAIAALTADAVSD